MSDSSAYPSLARVPAILEGEKKRRHDALIAERILASLRARHQINKPEVRRFEIGRTNDPVRRKSERKCDALPVLFEGSAGDAKIIEEALISEFKRHLKNTNSSVASVGPISEDATQYVYAALWMGFLP